MQYEYILFDLDGTLTDPGIGITNSVMYALNKYNISVTDRSFLYKFIGPPLLQSFQQFYGFTEVESNNAVNYYREYYTDKGIFENFLYDGIKDLLIKLKEEGRTLIVATSKPELFAKQILEHFEIADYFTLIAGSNLDETRSQKDEVISYALETLEISDLSKVIMIGDREYDIYGAKKTGIHSMGVLYGYGSQEEFEHAGADYIAETVDEIAILLNRPSN